MVSCFIYIQLLTIMFVATQLCQILFFPTIGARLKHSLLVLSYWKVYPFLLFVPPEDRDHTDSRRINKYVIVINFNQYFSNSHYCSDYVIINIIIIITLNLQY
uniref:Uncharacterized protein n=1 Tax=Mutinus fleischeri TaxID=2218478 RepID=A0A8K1RBU5_9AGAM|nr:hypothetical protein [Mutinus fleischeri]